MTQASGLQSRMVSVPAAAPWRSRTLLACTLVALMVLGLCASTLDWSEGLAMTLGQLAGMVAPLALLSLIGWGVADQPLPDL